MKRQIFTLLTILVLALGTALMAQTSTTNTQVPPSQQVDQSGKPEQTGRPDVDVDVGKNANNGVANVEVKRHGDSDTKAQGNTGTTGSTYDQTTTTSTGSTTGNDTNAAGDRGLPNTASDMPLLGLIGALSLAGALALRANR